MLARTSSGNRRVTNRRADGTLVSFRLPVNQVPALLLVTCRSGNCTTLPVEYAGPAPPFLIAGRAPSLTRIWYLVV